MKAQFLDLIAAADFLGPGAMEVNRYQTEIFDIVRRRGAFGQRIRQVPATGHPSRFFEETAIAAPTAAGFVDPRNIVATVGIRPGLERSCHLRHWSRKSITTCSTWKWERNRASSHFCRLRTLLTPSKV